MAASMRNPVVVILGATGTGKTKLSLEIAKRFNGEIISADSMQVYKGLDVITNKATIEERKEVPHHLIDYLSPLIEDSTVIEFRDKAVPIIDRLLETNKLPIIVGGTNYYIESLLWKYLINPQDVEKAAENSGLPKAKFPRMDKDFRSVSSPQKADKTSDDEAEFVGHGNTTADDSNKLAAKEKYARMTTPEIYEQVMKFDRDKGLKIHPNDRRKLMRTLQVYDTFGIPISEVYKAQHKDVGEGVKSGPLRYPHTCLFWLQCEKEVLRQRLDARVEQMIKDGLVTELTDFHKSYNEHRLKEGVEADYTRGIFQSIGFKEFHNYLLMDEEERKSKMGLKQFEEGKEALKTATKRYARIQNNSITTKILKRVGPSDYTLPVYGLDSTDVSKWVETVSEPAVSILESIIKGQKPDIEPIQPDDRPSVKVTFMYNKCNACDKVFNVEHDYLKHLKSKRHKYLNKRYNGKLEELSKILDKRADQLQQQQQTGKPSKVNQSQYPDKGPLDDVQDKDIVDNLNTNICDNTNTETKEESDVDNQDSIESNASRNALS